MVCVRRKCWRRSMNGNGMQRKNSSSWAECSSLWECAFNLFFPRHDLYTIAIDGVACCHGAIEQYHAYPLISGASHAIPLRLCRLEQPYKASQSGFFFGAFHWWTDLSVAIIPLQRTFPLFRSCEWCKCHTACSPIVHPLHEVKQSKTRERWDTTWSTTSDWLWLNYFGDKTVITGEWKLQFLAVGESGKGERRRDILDSRRLHFFVLAQNSRFVFSFLGEIFDGLRFKHGTQPRPKHT